MLLEQDKAMLEVKILLMGFYVILPEVKQRGFSHFIGSVT